MVEHSNQEISTFTYRYDHTIMIERLRASTNDVYRRISQYQAVTEYMKLHNNRAVCRAKLGFKLEGILRCLED